ncbi:hypothetical protein [Pandoraea sp.]|uniref:hypothetical protein n=1 Tax=Pandoraea sp. TaxID=1883445 RepID=UPI0025F2143C|nr:hypothetical protein [Pandoraea sp.]
MVQCTLPAATATLAQHLETGALVEVSPELRTAPHGVHSRYGRRTCAVTNS